MRKASCFSFIGTGLSTALLFTLEAGCGGGTQNTVATSTVQTPQTATVAVENKGPDLSAVSKPASVVLVARLNDFTTTVDSLDQIVKLPESIRSLIDEAKRKKDMDIFPPHASFDFALGIDSTSSESHPKFLWAFSVPLKSIDEVIAKAQKDGDEVRPSTPGAYRVKTKSDDLTCDVVPSVGDAPARAVCTEREERVDSLTELTPWLSRGLPAEAKKLGDLWVHADFAPLKERFLPKLKQEADGGLGEIKNGMQRELHISDPDLLDAPAAVLKELFAFADDSDSVDLSFAIDPKKPEMRLIGGMQFRSKGSWLTQVLASSLDRPEGPPEMFNRLPKDAAAATWARTSDPALFRGMRKIFHKGFESVLSLREASQFLQKGDDQAFLSWVDGVPSFTGVWVSASGSLPTKKGPEKDLTAQQTVDEAKSMINRFLPWSVSGGEGDAAAFVAWLKSSEDILNRGVGDIKKVAGKDAKDLTWLPNAKFTKDPAGYPKGSATLDVTIGFTSKQVWSLIPQNKGKSHPAGAEARGTVSIRIAVVPDEAGHLWLGYATDPEALRTHMAAVQKGAATTGTLAARTDLDTLKSQKGFGGFFSFGSLEDAMKNSEAFDAGDRKELEGLMGALPHKGQGDIFFYRDPNATGGALNFTFDVVASKEMVEDTAAGAKYLYDRVKEYKAGVKHAMEAPAQPQKRPPANGTATPKR